MHQEIANMLDMQNAMNSKVHADWANQGFAWYRAIWVECAELMDHYGWKWWKKQHPDMNQVTLEIVDIWHFGLSLMLQNVQDREEIVSQIVAAFAAAKPEADFRAALEEFTAGTLNRREFCIAEFATLMGAAHLSFTELYRQYLGKNVLNFFRQDNGYQEGTYRKIWQGKEDNEHLVDLLDHLDIHQADARDRLYKELERRYQL